MSYRSILTLRRSLLLVSLAITAPVCIAQTAGVDFTVEQLVQSAFSRNADLRAVRERGAEAAGVLLQAGLRPNPGVDVSVSNGTILGSSGEREIAFTFAQSFEVGGKRERRIEVAQWKAELVRFEVADRERRLAAEVKSAFGRALGAQRNLEVLRTLVETNEQGLRLSEARIREGEAPKLEGALLRVELNRIKADQLLLESQRTRALQDLRAIAGLERSSEIRLIGDLSSGAGVSLSLDALVVRALEQRPDLRAASIEEKLADAELRLAQAEARQDPVGYLRYSHSHSSFDQFGLTASGAQTPLQDSDNILTFGVSLSLTTRNRNQGNIDAAASRKRANELRREYLETQVRKEVESAYDRYAAIRDATEVLTRDVIKPSTENIATIRAAYELGELRLMDVVAEQRRLIDTEKTYTDLLQDYYLALVELEQAAGGALR
jgi:cobalt-zinc-cadmium efflux system outer membrane protein